MHDDDAATTRNDDAAMTDGGDDVTTALMPVIAIMAKAPEPGHVKTRLCPPLSGETAAELARCFLLDTVERVRGIERTRSAILYTPPEAQTFFAGVAPGYVLVPQSGGDLGARMASAFDVLLARGHSPVLVIGSDTPSLPRTVFHDALARFAEPEIDLVLGPSDDGGYYLIGLRARHPELFDAMPWSSDRVAQETVRRGEKAGLGIAVLPRWFDVDTPADLARLAQSFHDTGESEMHTARFLRDLAWR